VFNYELEATYQSGKFNELSINAYSLSGDVTYRLSGPSDILIGVGGNYISGDRDKDDNQLNTYNALFSKPQYGLTAPIGSPNIVNINPYMVFPPVESIQATVGAYFMWRQSTHDGLYSPLGAQVRPSPASVFVSNKRQIGTQLTFESSYLVTKNFSLGLDAGWFIAGSYVKETGHGNNILYLSFKGAFKF
jgi:hypothetical protein